METYIKKLKDVGQGNEMPEPNKKKEVEKLEARNPCVICCVTMGKQPHVGHLLLFTIAEQIRSGMDSKLPTLLINNNTGPRPAGALVAAANSFGLSLVEMAEAMEKKQLDVKTVVTSYRNRDEKSPDLETANRILVEGGFDIFAAVSEETEKVLKQGGYSLQIVSEAQLVNVAGSKTKNLNYDWQETGFTPFFAQKRVVILEKSGNFTATGALVTSVREIVGGLDSDLAIIVDSQPDIGDVAFVQTEVDDPAIAVQVLGTGVGFEGKISSGTKGEALTIKELTNRFLTLRPGRSLKEAALFLTLTRPLYFADSQQNLKESFFNFENNEEMLDTFVSCSDEVLEFKKDLSEILETYGGKVSDRSGSYNKAARKFLEFLPNKATTLFAGEPNRVLADSKKVAGGVRQNYYFNYLKTIIKTMEEVETITAGDLSTIYQMVEFCLTRTGL